MTGWIIAGAILLAIVLILCAPVCATVEYDGEFRVFVSYIFLRFRVVPAKPKDGKKKKQREKKAEEQQKAGTEEKKSLGEKLDKLKDTVESVRGLISAAGRPLKLLLKSITVFLFDMRIVIAGDDAAKTGENYGKACAIAYQILEQLRRFKRPWRERVDIRPDFIRQESEVYVKAKIGITPAAVIAAAVEFAFGYLAMIIKKKQKTNRPQQEKLPVRQ